MIREFDIQFDREEFESMYFKDYADSYLVGPKTKLRFIGVLSISIAMPLITFSAHHRWAVIMMFSWVLFVILWIDYILIVFKIRKWKREIMASLDEQEKIQSRKVELHEDSIVIVQDGNRLVKSWDNFHQAEISAKYLLLTGDVDYYFPASCMTLEDYRVMGALIQDKTKPEEIDLLDEL